MFRRLFTVMLILLCGGLPAVVRAQGSPTSFSEVATGEALAVTVQYPANWQVLSATTSTGAMLLSNGGNAAGAERPDKGDTYLTINTHNAFPIVTEQLGRVINSVDVARRIAGTIPNVTIAKDSVSSVNNVNIAITEFNAVGSSQATGAVLASPYSQRIYSVAIIRSGSAAQYANDLETAIAIFSTVRPATNKELVAGRNKVTLSLTANDLPVRVSGNGYSAQLPQRYKMNKDLAAATGLVSFGLFSTDSFGLDFYAYDGKFDPDVSPLIVIAPGLNTGVFTALGVQSTPRLLNINDRPALAYEGFASLGNFLNVAIRLDNGNYWSVMLVNGTKVSITDAHRGLAHSIAATLSSSTVAAPSYIGKSVIFDVENAIETGNVVLKAGASQLIGFDARPTSTGDLSMTFIYGDAEGDADQFKIALVSSTNPRAPRGNVIQITNSPEQQKQGIASVDITWFCDLRTYDGLYIMGITDKAGNLSTPTEIYIYCGGTSPRAELGNAELDATSSGSNTAGGANATSDGVKLIPFGEEVTGNFSGTGDPEKWQFEGTEGQVISITAGSEEIDVYFELFAPDGTNLGFGGSGDSWGFAFMEFVYLPQTGTYTIEIRGVNPNTSEDIFKVKGSYFMWIEEGRG